MNRTKAKLRLTSLVVAVAAIALGMAALPAFAHKITFDTHLQFKLDIAGDTTDTFSGKVTSVRTACEAGRSIFISHAGVRIATATSDPAGNWTVTGPRPPKGDDVTAFLPKKILKKNRKHRHRCARVVVTRKAP